MRARRYGNLQFNATRAALYFALAVSGMCINFFVPFSSNFSLFACHCILLADSVFYLLAWWANRGKAPGADGNGGSINGGQSGGGGGGAAYPGDSEEGYGESVYADDPSGFGAGAPSWT